MSQGAVLTAGQPENCSAAVGTAAAAAAAEDTDSRGKCIRPSAPRAAKTAKYRSSHATGDPFTARTATPLKGDRYLSSEPLLAEHCRKETRLGERARGNGARFLFITNHAMCVLPYSSLLPF